MAILYKREMIVSITYHSLRLTIRYPANKIPITITAVNPGVLSVDPSPGVSPDAAVAVITVV